MKENIILPENLMKLSFEKMDVWSFGFIAHRLITREPPAFDANRRPILIKSQLSPGMLELLTRCLSVVPTNRPSWEEVDLKNLKSTVVVEEVGENVEERSVIKLGTNREVSHKSEKKREKARY